MRKKRSGIGKFVTGVAIGAGLGILFAPKKGSETRKDLKVKMDELVAKLKEVDVVEVRENLEAKLEEIRVELQDLDQEKAIAIAKKKAKQIGKKCEELAAYAKEKGTPIIESAAEEVRLKAIDVTKEVLKRLEEVEK